MNILNKFSLKQIPDYKTHKSVDFFLNPKTANNKFLRLFKIKTFIHVAGTSKIAASITSILIFFKTLISLLLWIWISPNLIAHLAEDLFQFMFSFFVPVFDDFALFKTVPFVNAYSQLLLLFYFHFLLNVTLWTYLQVHRQAPMICPSHQRPDK